MSIAKELTQAWLNSSYHMTEHGFRLFANSYRGGEYKEALLLALRLHLEEHNKYGDLGNTIPLALEMIDTKLWKVLA